VVIRLKVPIEMHYTVIPMGTSKVNSSLVRETVCLLADYRDFLNKPFKVCDVLIIDKFSIEALCQCNISNHCCLHHHFVLGLYCTYIVKLCI